MTTTTRPLTAPARPDIPRRVDLPTSGPRRADGADGKKLIVGRDIQLAGAITSCDRLIVEGTVEANLTDAGSIEISETGLFKGTAHVDEAEIAGRFQGDLVVRRKLTLRPTGRIEGTLRYAKMVVEAGGQISGSVDMLGADGETAKPAAPVLETAP